MTLEYRFQSLQGKFPRKLTPRDQRDYSRFGKTWKQVQELLERELRMLGYRHGSVVILTGHAPYDVRNDGKLRADARNAEHPGVVVRFDRYEKLTNGQARYVPMSFECDQFVDWKANVRAIADAMEALRKINRYGVSGGGKAGAHYEGYKTLPPGDPLEFDVKAATDFLSEHSDYSAAVITNAAGKFEAAYKKAVRKLHPDNQQTGNHELFVKLQKAKSLLEKELIK
jgi:hypothetical protein